MTLAIPPLDEGECDALRLPQTPSVNTVGERCMDHGYSFHWPVWSQHPYLESPTRYQMVLT
eukprot:12898471-Prorocentrum_lima.AAC.1